MGKKRPSLKSQVREIKNKLAVGDMDIEEARVAIKHAVSMESKDQYFSLLKKIGIGDTELKKTGMGDTENPTSPTKPSKEEAIDNLLKFLEENAEAKKGEQKALPKQDATTVEENAAIGEIVKAQKTPPVYQPSPHKARKTILIIGLVVFLLMGLFPPWAEYGVSSLKWPKGYSFIFTQHNVKYDVKYSTSCSLDVSRLAVQWILVAVGTAGFVLLFDKKKHRKSEENKETPPRTG